jgi:hypothetical protein
MIPVQYPDTLSFTDSPNGTQDSQGNWVQGSSNSAQSISCRYESSGGNAFIMTADGKRINYSGIVYMPPNVAIIKEGAKVTITEKRDGQTDKVFVQEVLRFHRGQLNARAWL